jgi:hypothetical protein
MLPGVAISSKNANVIGTFFVTDGSSHGPTQLSPPVSICNGWGRWKEGSEGRIFSTSVLLTIYKVSDEKKNQILK